MGILIVIAAVSRITSFVGFSSHGSMKQRRVGVPDTGSATANP